MIEADLVDAAIRAARGALETGDRAKVRMLASVLVGATSTERPPDLDVESVVASLVSLTPADLDYARRLAEANCDNRFGPVQYPQDPVPDPDGHFRMMRLQGAGLVLAQGSGSMLGAGPVLTYRLTETFWRILDLLRAGGEIVGRPSGAP